MPVVPVLGGAARRTVWPIVVLGGVDPGLVGSISRARFEPVTSEEARRTMAHPQPGIFALGTSAHWHLEAVLHDGVPPTALADVVRSLAAERATTGGVDLVLGFGAAVWAEAGGELPEGMTAFRPIVGPDGFTVPATQGDVWAWLAGSDDGVVFDHARAVARALASVGRVVYEQHGFAYHDSRDLTGFVDGTENPSVDEAATVATVPDGRPGAGGSVVVVQRWVHDLAAFDRLPVVDQEAVIGRTKVDSTELDDDHRPEDAHISRVVVEEDGHELEIFRRSTPFGSVSEHGLQFVGFSRDQRRLDLMLARMVGADGGPRDRLTRFSTPVRSAYYFAPPLEALVGDG
ncbi:MAG: Dyp-type peroxidase [Actinomycetota bacterium]|nr:Dyp-type peroxidase [Actinomycetota bacterium]